jgi:hypothetical protein
MNAQRLDEDDVEQDGGGQRRTRRRAEGTAPAGPGLD